jgi:hypothetical protein
LRGFQGKAGGDAEVLLAKYLSFFTHDGRSSGEFSY